MKSYFTVAVSGTPLTTAHDTLYNPWHQTTPRNAGEKKLLLSVTTKQDDRAHNVKRPRQSTGQGWTVAVSAEREVSEFGELGLDQYLPLLASVEEAPASVLNTTYDVSLRTKNESVSTRRAPHDRTRQKDRAKIAQKHVVVSAEPAQRTRQAHKQQKRRTKHPKAPKGNTRPGGVSQETAIR